MIEEQKRYLTYVTGTGVLVPDGEISTIGTVHVTCKEDAVRTLETHQAVFRVLGLGEALTRVTAIVVQLGVEFDHTQIIRYQPQAAEALSTWIKETPMVCEAYSTDYQTRQTYRALVHDHYTILKMGPALAFALYETIFVLAQTGNELISPKQRNRILEIIDEVVLNEPNYWREYYRPAWSQAMIDIHFGFPDRTRYHWPHPHIRQDVEKSVTNLSDIVLPLGLTSQFMPVQFERLTEGTLTATPHNLIIDKVQDILCVYRFGCVPTTAQNLENT